MLLALSIVSEQGASLGPASYKVFDERGGSIGRVAGNDWVLPDAQNFVSSRHARVSANAGVFYLEDPSSNGTFINAPDQPASRAEPQKLSDGDRLFIGDYEIIVQLIPSAPAEATIRVAPVPAAAPAALPVAPPSALGLGTVDPLAALKVEPVSVEVPHAAPAAVAPAADISVHQAAMRAAARAGFNAMLAQLDPQRLEELYERKLKRSAMLGIGNKAKYWELFRAQFEEIARDREANFQLLFGDEFARTYSEHLRKPR
jgi:predicted component of type VI protein secretion system